jgi:hypothetical protein
MPAKVTDIMFHRISKPRWVNVVICEPSPGEYVWMSMYLRPAWRNGRLSREIIRYILHLLPGNHHIHFFPQITTLCKLAREESWSYQGQSTIYRGCIAFQARSPRLEPSIAPLLRGLLSHRTSRRRPWLPTFKGPESARQAVRRITRQFRTPCPAERAASNSHPKRTCRSTA